MIPALAAAWQRLIALLAWHRRTPQHLPAAETAAPESTAPEPTAPEPAEQAGGDHPAEPADHEAVTPVSPSGDGQADIPDPDQQEEEPVNATAAADLTPFHHPHFIDGRRDTEYRFGTRYFFQFRPFTGSEPKPEMPDGLWNQLSEEDDYQLLRAEYRLAYELWAKARFRRDVTSMLRAAVPVWQEYEQARNAMAAAFAAFWETSDIQWRAQILRLTDAHAQAVAAARNWDSVAASLTRAEHEHLRDVGEEHELSLRDVAAETGLDISTWEISGDYDYKRPEWHYGEFVTPTVRAVREEIERQKERLKEVDELATLRGGE
jgi:8-oxo-dGTP pyrophosphatase MutT (NUDIX family)